MTTNPTETAAGDPESPVDYDVVVVSGASGLSAAVFTARYGLDTLVLARGRLAIHQCTPGELSRIPQGRQSGAVRRARPHTRRARGRRDSRGPRRVRCSGGRRRCRRRPVSGRDPERARFRVETEDDRSVVATHVVTASAYDHNFAITPFYEWTEITETITDHPVGAS